MEIAMKRTAIVVAPGRGTYNRSELGYLRTHHAAQADLLAEFDRFRHDRKQATVSDLDAASRFSGAIHTRGDNASPLIYSCGFADFLAIDRTKIDIVAVTGNSMGWYTALACAGAVAPIGGFEIVNTMGSLMQESLIGGQLIYPFVDDDWLPLSKGQETILTKMKEIDARANHELSVSIYLGGMVVLAGNEKGLSAFEAEMPRVQERFPMRLPNHAAFHSYLQIPVAEKGRSILHPDLFGQPKIPLIDGRGYVWYPKSNAISSLYDYTLDHQVVETYDFTKAVQTAAREFMPDVVIVLGPGTTLGGATAQSLLLGGWRGLTSKSGFKERQKESPILISMGDDIQRALVV